MAILISSETSESQSLRVLIIEDSDRDVALEVRALKAAGYEVTYIVAENAVEMRAALNKQAVYRHLGQ